MRKLLLGILLIIPLKLFAPIDTISADLAILRTSMMIQSQYDLNKLLNDLSIPESGDIDKYPLKLKSGKLVKSPYHLVNENTGAAGRWQMIYIARKDVGYKGTLKQFLNSPDIQRKSIIQHMKNNRKYLERCLPNYQDYIGKTINGVEITWSAMVVAMYFAGAGGLKKFLTTGHNATDGNKTIKWYMQQYGNYEIGLII